MSKLGKFRAFLDRLQIEHCRPRCHHDATRCPIAQALNYDYSEFEWCPLCGSYKVSEQEIKSKNKSELGDDETVIRWLLGGEGGLILGFRTFPKNYPYKAYFACRCEIGHHARIDNKRIRTYDFEADPGSRDDCFQKRKSDLIKRDAEFARKVLIQEES